jgi:hypothetical protein
MVAHLLKRHALAGCRFFVGRGDLAFVVNLGMPFTSSDLLVLKEEGQVERTLTQSLGL